MNESFTRRAFLTRAAQCGAAAVLPCLPACRVLQPPGAGPVGIQLYAVKDELRGDPEATLAAIRKIGFGEVETAGFGTLTAQQFRRLLDAAGLECPSAHLQFDNLDAAFEQAHALGAHYATSGSLRAMLRPAPEGARGMGLEEAKRTAALANRIGAAARRAGLQYAYHNHDFEFADAGGGSIGYDLLLEETHPQLVQFEIDCGWMVIGGRSPRDYFERYPGRFPMIHVKDFLPPAPHASPPAGAELGHGMIDYVPIFAAAEKAGLKHYFAEQEGPFTRMTELQAAQQAFDYLRKLH
jgi:sugar phosphate isomerase/epimerase